MSSISSRSGSNTDNMIGDNNLAELCHDVISEVNGTTFSNSCYPIGLLTEISYYTYSDLTEEEEDAVENDQQHGYHEELKRTTTDTSSSASRNNDNEVRNSNETIITITEDNHTNNLKQATSYTSSLSEDESLVQSSIEQPKQQIEQVVDTVAVDIGNVSLTRKKKNKSIN